MLPAGPVPPNPSELLGSKRMEALLRELREQFDIVVLDSPLGLANTTCKRTVLPPAQRNPSPNATPAPPFTAVVPWK